MKNIKFLSTLIILLFISISINAQNNKLSLDLNYNTPIGDNFIGKFYNGILDIGAKYYFLEVSNFDFGLSGNFGLMNASIFNNDIITFMIKPRISIETKFWKLQPYIGIGYSFFIFDIDTDEELDKTKDGPNLNFGVKINILHNIYLNASYDFIKFRHEGPADNSNYNRNVQILNFGIGINI